MMSEYFINTARTVGKTETEPFARLAGIRHIHGRKDASDITTNLPDFMRRLSCETSRIACVKERQG